MIQTTNIKCPIVALMKKIEVIQTKTKKNHEKLQSTPAIKLVNNDNNRCNTGIYIMESK